MIRREEQRTAAFYDSIAHDYDARMGGASSNEWARDAFHEFVAQTLPPPARILDFGAGTGTDAIWYAQQGYSVTAYDNSPGMVQQLSAKIEKSSFKNQITLCNSFSSAADASTVGGLLDGIISNFAVFNLVEDLPSLFNVFSRIVRPGGYVITSVLNPLFWKDLRERWLWSSAWRSLGRGAIYVHGRDTDFYRYWTRAIVRAAKPAFRLQERASVGALVRRVRGSHDWNNPVQLSERLERRMWRVFPMTRLGLFFFLALERHR
jgi:SAM-dependent methyltransferase